MQQQSEHVSSPDITLSQSTHFHIHQIICFDFYNSYLLVSVWYISRAEFLNPAVCFAIFSTKLAVEGSRVGIGLAS